MPGQLAQTGMIIIRTHGGITRRLAQDEPISRPRRHAPLAPTCAAATCAVQQLFISQRQSSYHNMKFTQQLTVSFTEDFFLYLI
jgi:hypothetical protein